MIIYKKASLLYALLFVIIIPSCFSVVHETSSTGPKLSFTTSINAMKEAIKDTRQSPVCAHEKVVRDIIITGEGFTLINADNTERYIAFSKIRDPRVCEDRFSKLFFVDWGRPCNNLVFASSNSAKQFADAVFHLKNNAANIEQGIKEEQSKEQEDCLRLVRQTAVDSILAGTTSGDLDPACSRVAPVSLEAIMNEILIEWKNKEFPERLQRSSPAQLSDLVVKLEKGILKLDLKVKEFKDAADAEARQVQLPGKAQPGKAAPGALSLAHALDQRKTILMVILGAVKKTAAQRAGPGGGSERF